MEEIEEISLSQRIKARNTYELIRQGASINPQKVVLYFLMNGESYQSPIEITYQQLLARIHQTANLFYDLGVGKDDVISIVLPNIPHSYFAIWGGEAAGIINPINPALGPDQIKEIMHMAKSRVLVTLGPYPGTDIWEKVSAIRSDLSDLEAIVQVLGPGDEKEGIYSFDAIIDKYNPMNIDKYNPMNLDNKREIAPDEIAALFHTGGTTGVPKLAKHTHSNEVYLAWAVATVGDISTDDVLLCGLPLFHVNGVFITGLTPFSVGASVVLLSPIGYRDRGVIQNFYKIVERYRATFFSAVPSVYSALLQVAVGDTDISSLKYAICGAAPMPAELFREFERRTGMKILEGYGLTEGTCVSSANPKDGERRIGSIGLRLPYQPMKAVILDENGKHVCDCQVDEIGVITIKGPNVFPGYLQEEHNRHIWIAPGWLNTGDLGRRDADGYFYITGRTKDLIIRGDHNIDPAIIEGPLYQLEEVALAAAVGKPDKYAGEVPIAYVVLKEGAKITEEQLLECCRTKIGERAAVPKEIHIIKQMPLTAIGKIFKP